MSFRIHSIILSAVLLLSLCMSAVLPKNAEDWSKDGDDYYKNREYEQALKCYNRALESYPKEPILWYNKGNCYLKLGRYDDAIKCYDTCLSYDPNDKYAKEKRAEAKKLKEQAAAKKTPAPVSVDNSKVAELLKKANACYDKGEYEKAIGLYEAILSIDPNNKDAIGKKAAAEVLAKQGAVTPTPISGVRDNGSSGMVLINGGTFQMGGEAPGSSPVHSVTVSSFYMGKYEVTNREYCEFLNASGNQSEGGAEWVIVKEDENSGISGSNGSYSVRTGYENRPVVNVNWYGAVAYCNWLSDRKGLGKCYGSKDNRGNVDINIKGYRLPTEAEWEYACRAGTRTEYYWGGSMDGSYCWYRDNSVVTDNKAYYDRESGSFKNYHAVGQKRPNSFGLYDMSGNVWEWCNDWYGDYPSSSVSNPVGPPTGSVRVTRGGGWLNAAGSCRSAYRHNFPPDNHSYCMGFRTSRTP